MGKWLDFMSETGKADCVLFSGVQMRERMVCFYTNMLTLQYVKDIQAAYKYLSKSWGESCPIGTVCTSHLHKSTD